MDKVQNTAIDKAAESSDPLSKMFGSPSKKDKKGVISSANEAAVTF